MKFLITVGFLFSFVAVTQAQKVVRDSIKESFAIAEIGPAASLATKGGKSSYGFTLAIEATPIENWLEVELGVTPLYSRHYKETDVDFLFKKPWTLNSKLEFMLGAGPVWEHPNNQLIVANAFSGEVALDFMYWPYANRQFGWFFEPEYDYGFKADHEQSVGISAGLLISIQ